MAIFELGLILLKTFTKVKDPENVWQNLGFLFFLLLNWRVTCVLGLAISPFQVRPGNPMVEEGEEEEEK